MFAEEDIGIPRRKNGIILSEYLRGNERKLNSAGSG
jgi:hypothetical protein